MSAAESGSEGVDKGPLDGDELGAHVSASGGVDRAPDRAKAIESVVLQLFTKQPSRWAEPDIDADTRESFRRERRSAGIRTAVAHDSYLINLSSPDAALWERSISCFIGELRRSTEIGLDFVVSHPGNATDGDLASGISRNAEGVQRALELVEAGVTLLLELTAGSGTSVGGDLRESPGDPRSHNPGCSLTRGDLLRYVSRLCHGIRFSGGLPRRLSGVRRCAGVRATLPLPHERLEGRFGIQTGSPCPHRRGYPRGGPLP